MIRTVDTIRRDSLVFQAMTRDQPGKFLETAQEMFEFTNPLDAMEALEECCQIVEDQMASDTLTEDSFLFVVANDDEVSDELFSFIFELACLQGQFHTMKTANNGEI